MIKNTISEHIEVINSLQGMESSIEGICATVLEVLAAGKLILVAGNGGSASDAQHFTGELVGRYKSNRRALPSVCLSSDSSVLTCIGNDFGYDEVFSRQVEAFSANAGLLFLISTSGNSKNLVKAAFTARALGLKTVALLGKQGGELLGLVDHSIVIKSNSTARIQEAHILLIHAICDSVEVCFDA